MKRTVLFIVFLIALLLSAGCQPDLWKQAAPAPETASYTIDVTLDPNLRQLTGRETIRYTNTTREPIPDLVFHLYLNAFSSTDTIFMREGAGSSRGFPFDPNDPGWVEVTALRLEDGTELTLELLEDSTLARAALPDPVKPGQRVAVEVEFAARLPRVFARTGWAPDASGDPYFLVAQWFPKLGVWEGEAGWNAYSFHSNSEFYAEFGDYDVRITLPEAYVTGATGIPAGESRGPGGTRTTHYVAKGVIDFAWVASPNLQTASRRVGGTHLLYLYLPEHEWSQETVLDAAEMSITRFSDWYGAYPYPRLTILDVPDAGPGAGGMEYPMFITAGTSPGQSKPCSGWACELEIVTIHEVGHQWFQSVVATNEAEEPWLDEGMTDYITMRALIDAYGLRTSGFAGESTGGGYLDYRISRYRQNPQLPMYGEAWDFAPGEYGIAAYAKPAVALLTLERYLGEKTMLKIMREYAQRYRFGHPDTQDFRRLAERHARQDLDWFFDGLVYGGETVNYYVLEAEDHSVTLARAGELVVPVDVAVTFSDGKTETFTWDGNDSPRVFKFSRSAPVSEVEIDPEHKLLIDWSWSNNALRR